MHHHSNGWDHDWAWEQQARAELWDAEERRLFHPSQQQPPHTPPPEQPLTLLLTRRMFVQLQVVAQDLELDPGEAALLLLRDTLWRHYHMMQHI